MKNVWPLSLLFPPQQERELRLVVRDSRDLVPRSRGSDTLDFGGMQLPRERSREHNYLIVGGVGAGKTTLMVKMMNSFIGDVGVGDNYRMVVYDPQERYIQQYAPLLQGRSPVYAMNPYLWCGTAWDIGDDVRSTGDAEGVASMLISREPGGSDSRFFQDQAKLYVTAVTRGIRAERGEDWDLLDLLLSLLQPAYRKAAIAATPEGLLYQQCFGDEKFEGNLTLTLLSHIGRFLPLAAVMRRHRHAGHAVSFREWAAEPSLMVLGTQRQPGNAVESLNGLLVQQMTRTLLDRRLNPVTPERRTALFLDELATLGDVNGLDALLREGRNYGVFTTAGFQTITNLEQAYGEKGDWKSVVNLMSNLVALRQSCPETAEWLSTRFAEVECEAKRTKTFRDGKLESESEEVGGPPQYRRRVHSSELLTLPDARRDGVRGVAFTPLDPDEIYDVHVPLGEVRRLNEYAERPEWLHRVPDDWEVIPKELLTRDAAGQPVPAEPPSRTIAEAMELALREMYEQPQPKGVLL